MTDAQHPLIIKDFQNAVADSPNLGHALMRNIDIEAFPGAMKVKARMLSQWISAVGQTFTANAGTDICTAPGDIRTQAEIDAQTAFLGAAVTFTTSGTLPAGLSLNTTYFLILVSNNTFKVATTYANAIAGTAIDITDAGTGTHTIVPVALGTVMHIIKSIKVGYYFAIDSNGRVWSTRGGASWFLLNGNTLTAAVGNGLVSFIVSDASKEWLFVYRSAVIDLLEISNDTTLNAVSWTTAWKSMNSGAGSQNPHHSIVGQDNIIYFTDDRWVGSIIENAGSVFDPTSSGTYTYNNQALDMPQGEVNNWLDELGTNLLIAGRSYNKIYPWDRISDSFSLPLLVPEKGIYRIKNMGGQVYILAGTKGNIYYSQGTYVKLFKQVPGYLTNNGGSVTGDIADWGGIAICNGTLIFGMTSLVSGNSGVYKLYPDGRILQDNVPYGGSQQVSAIFAEDDFYKIGYAGGIDNTDSVRYAQGTFAAVYQSAQYRVSDKTTKGAYHELQVQIAKPATSGQIRVSYRRDDSSSFTVLDTYIADSASTSFATEIGLTDLEDIQIQVEFDANIELLEVGLYP